jgi:hypothetical protein
VIGLEEDLADGGGNNSVLALGHRPGHCA